MIIDRQNHHLFQPLLYQVATAAVSPAHRKVMTEHGYLTENGKPRT
jgi:NADH dehydrogenase FAD-containing subunit